MVEIEQLDKKLDDILARDDMYEERYQKRKEMFEQSKKNEYILLGIVVVIGALLIGLIIGVQVGYTAAINDITRRAVLTYIGVNI